MPDTQAPPSQTRLAERYRVLLDIGRSLTGKLSLEELYRAIYRETAQVLEASGFYISDYDQRRDLATVVFYADRGVERRTEITYRGSDSEALRTGRGVLVSDRVHSQSVLVLGSGEEAQGDPDAVTRSAISAPIRRTGRILGAISAQSYESGAYNEEDLELLQGIADIAGVAIENARFVAELQQRREEAEKIEEIGRALASSLDAETVLGKVVDAAVSLMSADGSTVWLIEGSTARVASSHGEIALPLDAAWELEGSEIGRILIDERSPVVLSDLQRSEAVPPSLREHLQGGSAIAVPMIVGGEVAGALSAGSRRTGYFTDEHVRVLQRIGSQAAVALENARLHASLHVLSLTDPLTGLPNRRHLEMQLDREVAAARRGRDLVVVLFDLDNFKLLNDRRGHLAGDQALRAIAAILRDEHRSMNLVARYGGDEFAAIVSDAGVEAARLYVRRVEARLETDPVLAPDGVGISAGWAAFDPDRMRTMDDVLRAADEDLYRRKVARP